MTTAASANPLDQLDQQIADAAETLRRAASESYAAYQAAKRAHDQLVAERTARQPRRSVTVVGATYPHRDALRAAGLRWDAMARAWIGTVSADFAAPAGCRETTYGAAAVASMDHAASMA